MARTKQSKYAATWGDDVEKQGYIMLPFGAMQAADEATYFAVMSCCYMFTWKGPVFSLSVPNMADRLGITRDRLRQQLRALADGEDGRKLGRNLITMTSYNGNGVVDIDMTRLISVINGSYQPQDVARAPQDVARAPQDVALPVATRVVENIDSAASQPECVLPQKKEPPASVKAILKRGKQLEERLLPHLEAIAVSNGQSLNSLRQSNAFDSLPKQVARAIDLGLTPEQTTRLYWWWISKTGKSFGIAATLSCALDDIQIWRNQKCPETFQKPGEKPTRQPLRNAAGQTLDEFQEAKMLKQVDWYAQWEPIYPEET